MQALRSPLTVVWLVLLGATGLSWLLGVDDRLGQGAREAATAVILAVAFLKVRLVGLYFMELRRAPQPLRAIFETYCLGLFLTLLGLYLFA